jgi:hypothetical protein
MTIEAQRRKGTQRRILEKCNAVRNTKIWMHFDWSKAVFTAAAVASAYYLWSRRKSRTKATRMTGKFAIVTGGTSGVGRVAAERLVKNGLKGASLFLFP